MTIYSDAYAAHVYMADVPASTFPLPLVDSDEDSLDWVAHAVANYVDPVGHPTPLAVAVEPSSSGQPTLVITWPDPSVFTLDGLGWILATVHGPEGSAAVETVDPHPVIVEAPGKWLTISGARRMWAEAPEDPWELFQYLGNALRAITEEAPWVDVDGVPQHPDYLLAQLIQARNTWEANRSGGQDTLGSGEFAIPRHPLDWQVRQLVRPRSADARNVVT